MTKITKKQLRIIIQEEAQLLHEQMLYEGMIDSIKQFAGDKIGDIKNAIAGAATDAKSFAVTLQKIISNPSLISMYNGLVIQEVITVNYNNISQIIAKLLQSKFPKLVKFAQFVKQKIDKIKTEADSVAAKASWTSVFILSTIATVFRFLAVKFEKLKLKDISIDIAKDVGLDQAVDQVVEFVKSIGDSIIQAVMAKVTDIKTYMGWMGKLIGGIAFMLSALAPVTSKMADPLIKEYVTKKELHNKLQRLLSNENKSKRFESHNTRRI